jgi:hypothetical protein
VVGGDIRLKGTHCSRRTQYSEDQRIGVDKQVDPTLESPRMLRPLPSPQGRVAAPAGAAGRGQTVPFRCRA